MSSTAPLSSERSFHRIRKRVHAICVLIFVVLPLTNLMRFDIPHQRFYFGGSEIWISEFAILFFTLMFLMFVIAAGAMIWGRVYCGYLCPQMIFSEASISLQEWLRRLVTRRFTKRKPRTREILSRVLLYATIGLASVFFSFVFIAYFIEPGDLLRRLLHFDVRTAGGIAGASVTLFTFLDLAFIRQHFCTTVCPYGYLQGILSDDETLIVDYRDPAQECINCRKCVRVCPMGIDIRKSPYQIECIHCGECVDACNDILARLGKDGLIHYAWGKSGKLAGRTKEPWYARIGIRNTKRVVILFIALGFAMGLMAVLSTRRTMVVQISPDRSVLYHQAAEGRVSNTFRIKATNRSRTSAPLVLILDGLPGGRFPSASFPIMVGPDATVTTELAIEAAPSKQIVPGVHHFRIITRSLNEQQTFDETFITPIPSSRSPQ